MKRTKIVATLGPSCSEAGVLGEMAQAGMDVARINVSHGTPAQHERVALLVLSLIHI